MKKTARKAKPRGNAAASVTRPARRVKPGRKSSPRKPRTMGEWFAQYRSLFPGGTTIERPPQPPMPPSLKLD